MTNDRLIVARSIMSPNHPDSLGDAVLVRDGRIIAYGNRADLRSPGLPVTDFGDAHVFPRVCRVSRPSLVDGTPIAAD